MQSLFFLFYRKSSYFLHAQTLLLMFLLISKIFKSTNMKKTIYLLAITLMLSFSFLSATASIASERDKNLKETPLTNEQKELRLQQITKRVEEIRDMDKSQLTRQERKELRKELKELKEQARPITGGGVYLSVGAILLIVLALILLL